MVNTDNYSDLDFWYTRGVDDDLKMPQQERMTERFLERNCIVISKRQFPFLDKDKTVKPIAFKKINSRIHVVLDQTTPDLVIILTDYPHEHSAKCYSIPSSHLIDVVYLDSDLLLLDATENNIIRIPDIADQVETTSISNKTKVPLGFNHAKRISVDNVNIEEGMRILPFSSSATAGRYRYLLWRKNTNNIWEGTHKKSTIRFSKTDLKMNSQIFDQLKFHSAVRTDREILLSTGSGARIIRAFPSPNSFSAKVLLGDGVQELKLRRGHTIRINRPAGLAAYSLRDCGHLLEKNLKQLFPGSWSRIKRNTFYIIVDHGSNAAVTFSNAEKSDEVLPLIGNFKAFDMKEISKNMALIEYGNHEEVTQGTSGELIFWTPGDSRFTVIDPKIGSRISEPPKRMQKPRDNISHEYEYT